MIVADYYNHRVVMLDKNGSWLQNIKVCSFDSPYGLTLDPQGNIHVTTRGSNTIKVFTPEGIYVTSYGDVKCPTGITVDEEGYSMVCELRTNCFSIFDPHGHMLHKVRLIKEPRGHFRCQKW